MAYMKQKRLTSTGGEEDEDEEEKQYFMVLFSARTIKNCRAYQQFPSKMLLRDKK